MYIGRLSQPTRRWATQPQGASVNFGSTAKYSINGALVEFHHAKQTSGRLLSLLFVSREPSSCETIASPTFTCSTFACSTFACSTIACSTGVADLQLSGMITDTAKRIVESTNVPQAITLLKGRVEITEERLANMTDKSFRSLEEDLVGLRAEVSGVHRQPTANRQEPVFTTYNMYGWMHNDSYMVYSQPSFHCKNFPTLSPCLSKQYACNAEGVKGPILFYTPRSQVTLYVSMKKAPPNTQPDNRDLG